MVAGIRERHTLLEEFVRKRTIHKGPGHGSSKLRADSDRWTIFYRPVFRDIAVKVMGLKAIWLMEQFKPFADNVLVFFDEPS